LRIDATCSTELFSRIDFLNDLSLRGRKSHDHLGIDQQELDHKHWKLPLPKVLVLSGVCYVAHADGTLEQSEKDLCYRAGKLLGFRKKDVEALLAQTSS